MRKNSRLKNVVGTLTTILKENGFVSEEDLDGHLDSDQRSSCAYVSFTCDDVRELAFLTDCIQRYSKENRGNIIYSFDYDPDIKKIRYQFSFEDMEAPVGVMSYYGEEYRSSVLSEVKKLLPI